MKNQIILTEGMELFSISTGKINVFKKTSRDDARYIEKLEGFIAVHPCPYGILWMFDSEDNAYCARNLMKSKKIICGNNICRFIVKNGLPEFDEAYAKEHGMVEEEE